MKKTAIIIGGGPAGLTAAYELLKRTDIHPIVLEKSGDLGGLAKTINYKGNRMDIGGHRFFSKSDRVMEWWKKILPIENKKNKEEDRIMLVRKRVSEMYFLRKFFQYPISLSQKTLSKLGWLRSFVIGMSYIRARLFPVKPEKNLEDFYINRFGRELYKTFFRDYTFKVWGMPASKIRPEWGIQRVKGLSISKAIFHAMKQFFLSSQDLAQKKIETSLIDQFLYPKYGPGQMWEETGRKIQEKGGEIFLNHTVIGIKKDGTNIKGVVIRNQKTDEEKYFEGDYFFSSMPAQELIRAMNDVPEEVRTIADGLQYRDFITVGLLVSKMTLRDSKNNIIKTGIIPDNWIYIQESSVHVGRLQIFNNWSPSLVKDPEHTVWLGLEYFCNKGDDLWQKPDKEMIQFGASELEQIGLIDKDDVLDGVVERVEKTYPAYTGTFDEFDVIRSFTDTIENLFLIGRNGMHRYNNQDHSMLTAMTAVDNIISGRKDKSNIWEVNTEEEYHEEKKQK